MLYVIVYKCYCGLRLALCQAGSCSYPCCTLFKKRVVILLKVFRNPLQNSVLPEQSYCMLPSDTAKVIINSLSIWCGRLIRGCIAFNRAISAEQYTSLWVSGNQAWNSNPGHGDARTGDGWWISDPGIRIPTWNWCVGSSAKLGQTLRGVLHSALRLSIQLPSSSYVVRAVYLKQVDSVRTV